MHVKVLQKMRRTRFYSYHTTKIRSCLGMKEGITFFCISNSDCYEQLTVILFQIHGIMFRSREIILLSSLSVFNSIRPYQYHKIGNNFFIPPNTSIMRCTCSFKIFVGVLLICRVLASFLYYVIYRC